MTNTLDSATIERVATILLRNGSCLMGPIPTIKQNDSISPNGFPVARYYTQEELDTTAAQEAAIIELMIFSPKLKIKVVTPVNKNGYYEIRAERW